MVKINVQDTDVEFILGEPSDMRKMEDCMVLDTVILSKENQQQTILQLKVKDEKDVKSLPDWFNKVFSSKSASKIFELKNTIVYTRNEVENILC